MFKEFFDALLEGKVLGIKCKDCNSYSILKSTCDNCGSKNVEKVELSNKGVIRTFTTTYVAPAGYDKECPYVVAFVELEEGCWLVGRLDIDTKLADEIGQDLIGKEVEIYGKEFPNEPYYPDKKRRVVPMFKLIS